jgi:tRNA threonylcarbamoyladenosine biosynthesis protein TsaB
MYVLAIDTSSKTLSVALLEDELIRAEVFINADMNHSIKLLHAIKYVYEQASLKADKADFYVCTTGPGSFTGLRIGVSTVKGLAIATGKPVIGISSLDALAANITPPASLNICPMLDAQRGQVYTALYKISEDLLPLCIGKEQVADVESFLKGVTENTIFLGSGAIKYAPVIKKTLADKFILAQERQCHVRAGMVGILGIKMFREGKASDPLTFAPNYLRPSEAERKFDDLQIDKESQFI